MDFERLLKLMAGAAKARRQFESAYEAGKDAGRNGPNVANAHFSWFGSEESTAEWVRGNRDGSCDD